MESDTVWALALFIVAMTFLVGFGYMIEREAQRDIQYKVACLASGRVMIEHSCVRVVP